MKIWRKRLTESMNESMNHEAVYRAAPATPGLLNISHAHAYNEAQSSQGSDKTTLSLLCELGEN